MAELGLKINSEHRLAYIPKQIHRILGNKPFAVTGRTAVVLFSEDTPIEDVARSLQVIQEDLAQAIEIKNRKSQGRSTTCQLRTRTSPQQSLPSPSF